MTLCPSHKVHLDAMDVAGDNQLDIEHEMIKQRLSRDGVHIGNAGIEIIGEVCDTYLMLLLRILDELLLLLYPLHDD